MAKIGLVWPRCGHQLCRMRQPPSPNAVSKLHCHHASSRCKRVNMMTQGLPLPQSSMQPLAPRAPTINGSKGTYDQDRQAGG